MHIDEWLSKEDRGLKIVRRPDRIGKWGFDERTNERTKRTKRTNKRTNEPKERERRRKKGSFARQTRLREAKGRQTRKWRNQSLYRSFSFSLFHTHTHSFSLSHSLFSNYPFCAGQNRERILARPFSLHRDFSFSWSKKRKVGAFFFLLVWVMPSHYDFVTNFVSFAELCNFFDGETLFCCLNVHVTLVWLCQLSVDIDLKCCLNVSSWDSETSQACLLVKTTKVQSKCNSVNVSFPKLKNYCCLNVS